MIRGRAMDDLDTRLLVDLLRDRIRPNRSLGQHFLVDDAVISRSVALASCANPLGSDSHVLEIGPGPGSLTLALLRTGARVTAFEVDGEAVSHLQRVFGDADGHLDLHQADALEGDWPADVTHMVANLPYQISSPVLERIQRHHAKHPMAAVVLLLQEEFAERMAIGRNHAALSPLGLSLWLDFDVELDAKVPPHSFSPCEGTGLQYLHSVQDLIGEPLRIALNAEDTSFHGMGREDIDVRCLGSGRPFVLEIKNPKIRETDLDKLVSAVNESADGKVEIDSLRWSKRGDVRKVKETRSEKTYTIRLKVDDIPDENTVVKSILSLSGVVLEQETPKRVSHRRAAKTRKRRIVSISDVFVEGDEVQMTLRCEAGTYIKELVHSDEGRTVPSVSGALERECEVLWLDVEEIHAD